MKNILSFIVLFVIIQICYWNLDKKFIKLEVLCVQELNKAQRRITFYHEKIGELVKLYRQQEEKILELESEVLLLNNGASCDTPLKGEKNENQK